MANLEFAPHVLRSLMDDLEFGCQYPNPRCAIEDFAETHLCRLCVNLLSGTIGASLLWSFECTDV